MLPCGGVCWSLHSFLIPAWDVSLELSHGRMPLIPVNSCPLVMISVRIAKTNQTPQQPSRPMNRLVRVGGISRGGFPETGVPPLVTLTHLYRCRPLELPIFSPSRSRMHLSVLFGNKC